VGGKLLRFSVPFILANICQTAYGVVDAMIVGRYVGTSGLSAVTSCGELIQFYTLIAIGFSGAGQTIIGQIYGAKDMARLRRAIGSIVCSILAVAVLLTVFSLGTASWQLRMLQLPESAQSDGMSYLVCCSAGLIFIFGYNLVSAILRGLGDSKRPLIIVVIASVTNLLLDLLFVAVLGFGVLGAALATVAGQGISLLLSAAYLLRRRGGDGERLELRSFYPERTLVGTVFRLGIPMAAQGSLVCVSMLYVYSQINAFGVAASAANGITNRMCNIVRIVTSSMATASAAMIAQNIGADKQERVPKIFRCSLAICLVSSVTCSAVILAFPQAVFSLFDNSAEVLAYAPIYAVFGAIDYISYALRAPCNGVLSGTGAATLAMISSIADGVVARIGFSILFGNVMGMGVAGYWLANTIAGYVSVLIAAPYYFTGAWKRKRILIR
jgi:putative MATE family efflux protein